MPGFRITSSCLILLFFLVGTSGCGNGGGQRTADLSGRTINVVATTGMIGDAVQNVGGERIELSTLMGPGTDPHLYQASEGDVNRLHRADIIFYNGLHLEGRMAELLERMGEQKPTVAVGENIPENYEILHQGQADPHIWMDVTLWKYAVAAIESTLVVLDSTHSAQYQANAEVYQARLDSLQAEVNERIGTLPAHRRILVTAHDAFNYFGRAYGFQLRGLQGISTATEAGTGDVQRLVTFIVDHEVPAVFVESSIPRRNIEAVVEAVRARDHEIRLGGELFSDALGTAGTPEGTYIGMIRHNVTTIVEALGD